MSTRIVIVGGGALGLSLAYHLALRGESDVTVFERNQLTSGTTWHAAGIVGPLRATAGMTRLAMQALETFPQLESETGQQTGYQRTGGYWLARRSERMDELERIATLGQTLGITTTMWRAGSLRSRTPFLNLESHVGALEVAEDARVNPVDLCMAYARAAKSRGVVIRENVTVEEIVCRDGRARGVRLGDGTEVDADQVALCGGAWSRQLAQTAGVALPLQAVEHMYVVTEPVDGIPEPFPVVRDLDTGIYIKGDAGGKLVIGGFEPDAKCWDSTTAQAATPFLQLPDDWDQFSPFMEAALNLMPGLETAGIAHFMNGPESFTADSHPLVGETTEVDGLYVAAGMNSVGVMSSAGIGKALADWMIDGQAPSDLWEIDVARADPRTASDGHLRERMREAVADVFELHWPFKQPKAGRGLRQSCLHDHWAAAGAVFGLTGGWERGLWYARNESETQLPYSVGQQPWQPIAEREAGAMDEGTVLVDLSPFGKFDVQGPDAVDFLQRLACADVDVPVGQCVYTALLNDRGGIEADVTLSRLSPERFRLTSSAATRWRDGALLRRRAHGAAVTITDVTEHEAVIGVMGAGARATLQSLANNIEHWTDFAFGTTRQVVVAGVACRATRLSFVGELGWELSVGTEHAEVLFQALESSGASPMGHYALEGCRLEKGYRAFGHDLGPDITPLEAGLGFTVGWQTDFVGRDTLVHQRESGVRKRLVLMAVDGEPLVLHDEPVVEDGSVVGLTTSGGKGPRTGLTLAFALIDVAAGETLTATRERSLQIDIAGTRYDARILKRPPFDPSNARMRA